uniref:Uncharacterized protein n=1 Tax=Anguilla anguilla TaxID=7936 RepID=A0A0E9RZ23_ANGAN
MYVLNISPHTGQYKFFLENTYKILQFLKIQLKILFINHIKYHFY